MTATNSDPKPDALPIKNQSDCVAVAAALAHHADRFPSEFRNAAEKIRQAAVDAAHSPQDYGLEADVDDLPAVIDG